jgi:hypothetical protein
VWGNWLKPPAKLGFRATVVIFAVLPITAAVVTYVSTEPAEGSDDAGDKAAGGPGSGAPALPAPGRRSAAAPPGAGPTTTTTAAAKRPHGGTTTRAHTATTGLQGSGGALTTIANHVSYADQTVTMSYDTGSETRTYEADGTFSITRLRQHPERADDPHERHNRG